MKGYKELEDVLLDQIEKLNDETICTDEGQTKLMIERSKAISSLTDSFVNINRMKIEAIKTLADTGGQYGAVLGIEDKPATGKKVSGGK